MTCKSAAEAVDPYPAFARQVAMFPASPRPPKQSLAGTWLPKRTSNPDQKPSPCAASREDLDDWPTVSFLWRDGPGEASNTRSSRRRHRPHSPSKDEPRPVSTSCISSDSREHHQRHPNRASRGAAFTEAVCSTRTRKLQSTKRSTARFSVAPSMRFGTSRRT